ncbi:hypothetical protein C2I36_01240 [Rhodobacteraceae bacterium WD3A24]|nr:hypothetical protein C2I36_01240 [Rhodobacteraceae bacterium WD3A24]
MWLSDRRSLLAGLAALPLAAACGFRPAYGPGGGAARLRGAVRPDDPENRADFAFVAALEERLGRSDVAPYALSYDIDISGRGVARERGMGDTRRQLAGTVDIALTDRASGATLTEGRAEAFVGYSTTSTQLATAIAEDDGRDRLMRILADRVATLLIAAADDLAR